MDEPVFADEMERLRLEQLALEQQLANIDANMAYTLPADVVSDDATKKVAHVHVVADVSAAAAAAAEPTSSLKMDRRAVMPVNDDAHDVVAAEAAAEPSLRERIADLEKMRAHYSRAAQQSMNAYLRTIHHTDDYANRRATQLQPQPFSFNARERTKSAGIREARRAREQREREAQEQEQQQPFRATPVPPTTFMNKYGIMVEEWKERKSAMEMLAKERADCAKREADYVRLSAEALRHTREDLLGVRRQPTTAQQRRAQSVAEKKKRRAASSPHADDVPMEVQLQLWPSIKEHEQVRKERIKVVAAERRVDINAQFTEMMPLMSSPTPAKIYQHTTGTPFGIGQAITASAPAPTPSPTTTTPAAAAAVVSGVVAVGTTAVSPTTAGGAAATCVPPSNSPTTAVPPPPPPTTTTATAPTAAAPPPPDKKAEREAMYVKHHPQLTFHPKVKPGVPNFQQLWAADKVELIERKQKRPTTTPTPFHLTPSPKDAVRGKKYVRQTASPPPPPQRARSAPKRAVVAKTLSTTSTKVGTTTTTTTTVKKDADATTTTTEAPPTTTTATTAEAEAATANVGVEATAPTSAKMNPSPHGTRAHALRTEAIFSKYINKVELVDHVAEQDARYLQQVHQRRREVRKRVGKYLANYSADHDRAIAKKVATLKRQMREAEHDARDRLMEMHKRVQSMPPVFAEPVHLAEMSKARAETEKEIVAALRETKLDERTIRAILAAEPPTSATAEADATTPPPPPATTTTTATANGAAEPSATTPAVGDGSPGDVPAADSVGAASPTVPAHTSAPSSAVSSSSSSAYSDSFDSSSSDSE